jgi:hypothetical protein
MKIHLCANTHVWIVIDTKEVPRGVREKKLQKIDSINGKE